MASIAGTNAGYLSYRNRLVGDVSVYTTTFATTDTYNVFFSDDADVDPDDGHDFASSYAAGDNPNGIANYLDLTSVTAGAVATGVFNCATMSFTSGGASEVTVGDPLESLIICRNVGPDTAASSPVMIHIGSATGLSGGLTPNGATVTVVPSASGIFGV